MDVDGASAPRKQIERVSLDDTNLIDDDDLAATLARQRREGAKQRIKELKARAAVTPAPSNGEDAAIKVEEDGDMTGTRNGGGDDDDDDGDVLVLDDTSEFVRNISHVAAAAQDRAERDAERAARLAAAPRPPPAASRAGGVESVMPVIKREEDDVPLDEVSGGWGAPREDGEEDEQMMVYDPDAAPFGHDESSAQPASASVSDLKPEVKYEAEDTDALPSTGQELLVSRGMASTLSMLRHQGLVKTRTPEDLAREKELKEREAWLAEQRRREHDRERERLESRKAGDQKGQQQREYENRVREQRDAQASLEAFSNYKPVVNLTYHDEFGRDMTPKEVRPTFFPPFPPSPRFPRFPLSSSPLFTSLTLSPSLSVLQAWKHLSHAFHGHGSGSKKTDKRLKKIENERKAASMAAGDTPLSSAAAFAARAEMMGSATMVLGVGNNKFVLLSSLLPHPPNSEASLTRFSSHLQLRTSSRRRPRRRHQARQRQRQRQGPLDLPQRRFLLRRRRRLLHFPLQRHPHAPSTPSAYCPLRLEGRQRDARARRGGEKVGFRARTELHARRERRRARGERDAGTGRGWGGRRREVCDRGEAESGRGGGGKSGE